MENVSTGDIIEYLIKTLRFLDRKQLIQFARILLEQHDDYYFTELSACDLEKLIIDSLNRAKRELLVECGKTFIPNGTNFSRCQICRNFMEGDHQLPCGHNVHTQCIQTSMCPACVNHLIDMYQPKSRL